MKTKHIVSRKDNTITSGTAITPGGALIVVRSEDSLVNITIDGWCFGASNLRETAKFFTKLADVLDAQ